MSESAHSPILVLCRDLLFASKITSTAQAVNIPVRIVRDPAKLGETPDASRLIVDLTQPGFIEAAAEWKRGGRGQVTGFAGHADTETIARATAAGIDQVLTRGMMSANLEEILRGAG